MVMAADPRPVVYPPRCCARTDGTPKVGFPTRRAALRSRRAVRRKGLHAYQCPLCAAWHLGKRLRQGQVA